MVQRADLLSITGTCGARSTSIWSTASPVSKSPAKSTCKARVRFHRVAMVGELSPRSIWLTMERLTPERLATASKLKPCARRASFRRAGRRVRISSVVSVITE